MAQVFISHSSADSDFAGFAWGKLRDKGINVWLDQGNLNPGDDWKSAIDEGLSSSDVLIVVVSEASSASSYVAYEWAYALGSGARLIPIVLNQAGKLHPRLGAFQSLDFTNLNARPWDRLIEAIQQERPRDYKLSPQARADLDAIRSFYETIKGPWWERITERDGAGNAKQVMSFFQIVLDEPYCRIRFDYGHVYDEKGVPYAGWNSVEAHVMREQRRVLYLRECTHPGIDTAEIHGCGDVRFDPPTENTIDRGRGNFWDLRQGRENENAIRQVDLRRVEDKIEAPIMSKGTEKQKSSLVVETLDGW